MSVHYVKLIDCPKWAITNGLDLFKALDGGIK